MKETKDMVKDVNRLDGGMIAVKQHHIRYSLHILRISLFSKVRCIPIVL
ncbi:hypothetical protein [Gracilibacillus salinarum]|uniref:Uncharacterized protein n=1 Tax=Gracilibacillus salinarum TaxID=2932255 RepID=A0ABY4GSF8_9BACI|nr:hypothetical protein [Gracilibacillus salinarum]UOQ86597.1 hypothetical protein MUN87_06835 [Gracilibacillus salinarum]